MLRKFFKNLTQLRDLTTIGVAEISARVVSSVFWLYVVNLMEVNEYGLVNYYVGIASITQIIALVGTTNALTVYVSKGVKIQSTFFAMSLIGGSICAVILFLVFQKSELVLLLIMLIIGDSVGAVLLGKRQYFKYAVYTLIQKSLLFILGIIFLQIFGFVGILYGIGMSYLFFIPIFYKFIKESKIDFTLLKEKKNFIINDYIVMLASGLRRDVDKLIIPALLGFAALGNYTLSIQIYTLLMTFSVVFHRYILPYDAIGKENKRLKKIFVLFTIALTIIGICIAPTIITNLFTKYVESITIIQIMIVAIVPQTINMIHLSKFSAYEKSKYSLLTIVIQLFTLIVGFIILGNILDDIGIAISFVLSATISMLCSAYLNRLINVKNNN